MSEIAHEVSRRMTPAYAKERARDMARARMWRARDRAVESPWLGPLIGAGVGALVAKALQSRAQDRAWERSHDRRLDFERGAYAYGYPRGATPAYAEDREDYERYGAEEAPAGEAGSKLGEKAAEVKERTRAKADEVKDRLQGATSAIRERLPDRERIRTSTREDAGFWALGALALGALFGFALPETRRERELLEPARRKARELGHEAREKAFEKGAEALEKATEKVGSAGEQQPQGQPPAAPGAPPFPEAQPPIH